MKRLFKNLRNIITILAKGIFCGLEKILPGIMARWRARQERLENNYQLLKSTLEAEAEKIEKRSHAELHSSAAEELSYVIIIDGHECHLSFEAIGSLPNGDLEICIDIDSHEMPTKFGIKPSWHFFKRQDGSVYY